MIRHHGAVIAGIMIFFCFLVSPVSALVFYDWAGTTGLWNSSNWTVTNIYGGDTPNPYPQAGYDAAFIKNGGTVEVASNIGPLDSVFVGGHSTLIQTGGIFSVSSGFAVGGNSIGGEGTVILSGGSFNVSTVTKTDTTTNPFSFIIEGTGPDLVQCSSFTIDPGKANPLDTVYFKLDSNGVTTLYAGSFNCPRVSVSLLDGELPEPNQVIDLIRVNSTSSIVIGGVALSGSSFTLDYDLPLGYEAINEIVDEDNWKYLRIRVIEVSEPATITLLCLGGLLFRRKTV